MNSSRRWAGLMPVALLLVAGCATEPEINDDYTTFEAASEPIPLVPIPGADLAAWTEAIEELDHDEWSSAGGLVTDAYEPTLTEPEEDPRIEADRYSWAMAGSLPHGPSASFDYIARAVTDADGGLLSIICEADYDVHAEELEYGETSLPFGEVRRVMLGCMAGAGNAAIGSDELSAWMTVQMDAAQAAFDADERHDRFQVLDVVDAENVLVWFDSNERRTAVSLHVDPRAEADSAW